MIYKYIVKKKTRKINILNFKMVLKMVDKICLFVLRFNTPVNTFSVMSGQSR